MIETVVALLMFWDGEIKEHRIQKSMAECLRARRPARRRLAAKAAPCTLRLQSNCCLRRRGNRKRESTIVRLTGAV